jgi:NAD+ synthase (glutamine-hydrolysing)
LACAALGRENVWGIALPSPFSSQASIDDAHELARNLGIRFDLIPITDILEVELQALAPLFAGRKTDVTEQNIQARIRGNLLMALSNKFGHLLLSTGNKSEMAVGYCTLYGDMSGGLAIIADVPKCQVYELARFINRERPLIPEHTISRAPSAELAPDQKDEDDLPPYPVLDRILQAYLEEHLTVAQIIDMGFDPPVVKDVVRRVRNNEYKRKQAPLGLKVTSKAFGYGRRYPTAERFTEDLA